MKIIQAKTSVHIDQARQLFKEYADWLQLDLCFQNFEKELAELPGAYAPPEGRLLLAYDEDQEDQLAGCVALRKLDDGICEMKRLFLRPAHQGRGLGGELIDAIISQAKMIGYQRMRLDTLPPQMDKAIALYRKFGFEEIEPYYNNPMPRALFMELKLPPE